MIIVISDMPSKKKSSESSQVAPLVEEPSKSLRPRRSLSRSNTPTPKSISPTKPSPMKIKLNKLSKSVKCVTGSEAFKPKSLTSITFVNEADQAASDFLIKDFRKIVTIRNAATSSLSSTADDEDDPDHEALVMLGKYGNASRMISGRSAAHEKGDVSHKPGHFGFKTPTKKGQMFEKAQELLASVSSSIDTPISQAKLDSAFTSPKASRSENILKKMANTPSANVTPARRALMNSTIAAQSPSGRKAHRNILEEINDTPKKPNGNQPDTKDTPLKQLTLKACEHAPPTPHGLRKRVTRNLQKLREQEQSELSESSSDDEDRTEEDIEEMTTTSLQDKKLTKTSNTSIPLISQSKTEYRQRKFRLNEKENTDVYFETHGKDGTVGDRIYTSDNTLSRNLKTPLLSPEDLKSLLDNEGVQYEDDIHQLLNTHRQMFDRWMLWLWQDFNLVSYGLGSKRELLSDFHQHISKFDPTAHVLVVNGYFPSLTLRHIFTGIIDDLLDGSKPENNLVSKEETVDSCEKIFRLLSSKDEYLYLIIHNLDGLALRSEKIQGSIAKLASNPRIRLIASIDHVNAPLLWDADKRSKFNFVWYDATTFLPYTEETLNENSLMLSSSGNVGLGGGSGALALSSLSRVFESLTPNAKEIYITIVKYQLEALDELKKEPVNEDATKNNFQLHAAGTMYQGLSFTDLYRRCRRAFLVNSDLTLRAQLTEFRDHKLIRERKGVDDGIDYLIIPLNSATLTEFLVQRNNVDVQ